MKVIVNFFTSIIDVIKALIDFVIGFIQDIVSVVKLVGEFVLKIPDLFSWLPPSVLALIVTLFSIVVLYKILGREG